MISSVSWVSSTTGQASTPPKRLNSAALPSITGSAAAGPMLPSPSTADPSVYTVAVVTDGSAVLGLGNIGPAAALPVMEGKAALFKRFGGVDAWPVVLDTQDTEEIIRIVRAIAPAYGGVNLEDIAAPRCFEIEARLRELLDIPVFHDD